jgi:hypothetical protein
MVSGVHEDASVRVALRSRERSASVFRRATVRRARPRTWGSGRDGASADCSGVDQHSRRRRLLIAMAILAGLLPAARSDAYLYWGSHHGSIGRTTLDGKRGNRFFIRKAGGLAIAVDASHIYWIDSGATSIGIGRANLDGTGKNRHFIRADAGETGLAVDAAHIYWVGVGGIARANLDGTGVDETFIKVRAAGSRDIRQIIWGVAVHGDHIYWSQPLRNRIGRADLNGGSVDPGFVTAPCPDGIAVDKAHIYWKHFDGDPRRYGRCPTGIGRANLAGGGVKDQFIRNVSAAGVAVDAAHVYWNDPPALAVGRANLRGGDVREGFAHTGGTEGLAVDALGPRPAGRAAGFDAFCSAPVADLCQQPFPHDAGAP